MKEEKTNLLIYRVREKGLEVFLVNHSEQEGEDQWSIPSGDKVKALEIAQQKEGSFTLEPVEEKDGIFEQTYAVEADWHDIPSMKSILKNDVGFVKKTIKRMVPDMMQKGTFVAVKEAFKKVLPHQYESIKELKEILIDRNLTKYM